MGNAQCLERAGERSDRPFFCLRGPYSKADRDWINSRDLLEAQRHGRDRQLAIIGSINFNPKS